MSEEIPPPHPDGSALNFYNPSLDPGKAPKSVGFRESVARAFTQFLKFSGRASRSEYWWYFFFLLLSQTLYACLLGLLQRNYSSLAHIGAGVTGAIPVLLVIPLIALATRRIQDTGRSPKFVFGFVAGIFLLAPIVASIFFVVVVSTENAFASQVILTLVSAAMAVPAIYLLVTTLRPGTAGANAYGPGKQ